MTAITTPSQVQNQAIFDVYVKAFSGGTPAEGGIIDSASSGDNGWERHGYLRMGKASFGTWPSSGVAGMDLVGPDGVVDPFELGLFDFQPDDQVRIVMHSPNAGNALAPNPDPSEDTGNVIFEGTLQRAGFGLKGATDKTEEFERFGLVAVDAPSIDNLQPEHLVRGRFVADDDTPTPVLIDAPSVGCVFNANDRPNRSTSGTVNGVGGELTMTAPLFTADGDPAAEYFTVKDALQHLVVCWLFGIESAAGGDAQGALTRSATLEADTYAALFSDSEDASSDRWAGLDKRLPKIDTHGVGVFDAIDRVCRAGGYRCAVLPPMGRSAPEGANIDRQYQMRIWRAGAGPENTLRLVARELVDDSASVEQVLANNNVTALRGLRDTSRVRNNIIATGRTLIETTVELKPLFSDDDMADHAGSVLSLRETGVPVDQAADDYHQRHVHGGALFGDYRHVGRRWGLDETGAFQANSLGYETGDYAHDEGGFDWLAHLGIDGNDDMTAARTANGVTDPIRWSRRVRRPIRLSRPEAIAINQAYRLDVSEDGGNTWHQLPASAFTVLTEGYFGIMLRDNLNLAAINRETFGEASRTKAALPSDSWWALLDAGTNLRFRLTCLIEADFAARFDAPIDAGSTTRTPMAQLIETGVIEVWQSPSSIIGDTTWKRLDDRAFTATTAGADRTANLQDLAERIRDERGQMRWSVTASHWLMDPTLFSIGDVITGIAGRVVDFRSFSAGSGLTRHPSVVAMTIDCYPSQNITIDIGDEAARRGV